MYTTEGIILKRTDVREVDSFFTIYTKDFGKIRAFAQGVKKEGAKLKGHLEPLSLSAINFVLGKNSERLTGALLLNYWPRVRTDPARIHTALAVADLVDTRCLLGERDEKLWELLLKSFLTLENTEFSGGNFDKFLQEFRESLIAVLGYAGVSEAAFLRYNA